MKSKCGCFVFCLFAILLTMAFLQSGCGLIGTMGTPTRYEKKVPAEYNLTGLEDHKILVLVKQQYWLDVKANMRLRVTNEISRLLKEKARVSSSSIIGYNELSAFRSSRSDFSLLSAAQIGKELGADMVLLVNINNCQLEKIPEMDFYAGHLSTQAVLIESTSGDKLWPDSAESKNIRVGFEIENKGFETAVSRLANASAHCIVRYFYDCKVAEFKIKDDKSAPAWEYWK